MLPKARCNLTACALSFYDGFSSSHLKQKTAPASHSGNEASAGPVAALRQRSGGNVTRKKFFEMLEAERFP